MIKKFYIFLVFTAFILSGCTSHISDNIPNDGVMQYSDVKFPDLDKSWIKKGSFPNLNNLKKIRSGMTKDQIRFLIGHPHFAEGFSGVKEWDYILNFIEPDNSVKVCQYKVIFDDKFIARSFFFKPIECEKFIGKNSSYELVELSSDILFDFDKSTLKKEGKESIVLAYEGIKKSELESLSVVGHTDPLGKKEYNIALSQRRANTVKQELIRLGIPEEKIKAYGVGEERQVKVCDKNLKKNELIKCLKPNRRVDLNIKYFDKKD